MKKLPDMVSYFDKNTSISLEIPGGWSVGSNANFDLFFLSQPEQGYRTNLGFSKIQIELPSPEHLQKIIDNTKADQLVDYDHFREVEEVHLIVGGYPAYLQKYEWQPEETRHHFSQVLSLMVVGPETLLEIHGATLKQMAATYIPILEHIIKSVRIIPT